MKKALTEFYKSVQEERTLRDEIMNLIEFICKFDWDRNNWVNGFKDTYCAEWSVSVDNLVIKVYINIDTKEQKNKEASILESGDVISTSYLYRMVIQIVGDEEKSLVRELRGRFAGEQSLNKKDGVSLAKSTLKQLQMFLIAKGVSND